MTKNFALRKPKVSEVLLLAVLVGLVAYAYAPKSALSSPDPLARKVDLLRSGSAAQRAAAATDLARAPAGDSPTTIPALVQALTDLAPEVRLAAAGALHSVPPGDPTTGDAVAGLIRALKDTDARVRAIAAGVLSLLKPDPNLAIPALAAAANGEGAPPTAVSSSSGSSTSAATAEESIARSQEDHARASAVAALAAVGPRDHRVLESVAKLATDQVSEVRMVVARVLGEIGTGNPQALGALLKLTADPDLYIQAQAVLSLGSFPSDYLSTCPVFYRSYLSKARQLQEGAEISLDKILKTKAFDAAAARQSKDAALRFAAIYGLKPSSDARFQDLVHALADPDPGVRIMAATRLSEVPRDKAPAALEALKSLSKDPSPDVVTQVHLSQSLLIPRPARSTGR
jgi:HEAT repeat protein